MTEDRRAEAKRLLALKDAEKLLALRQAEAAELRQALGPVHPLLLERRLLALRAKEA